MFDIRDPIHRTVPFTKREKSIIDHPFLQRLRYVRQLGLAYLVYPGALHDRFSHALGAMHVAGRIWERISQSSAEVLWSRFNGDELAYFRETVRFAGLLHDLGHPPFSHVSEKFMPRLSALAIPEGWFVERADRQARHEDYSVALIAALADEREPVIGKDQAQDVASLIHHGIAPSASWVQRFGPERGGRGGIHPLLRSLISGELDCDRMDYLLRDAYFTGVAYGTHDIEHLIGNLGVVDTDGNLMLTIDSTAVRAFEDFLLARYHMFLQVYMHKTTIAFDYFLEKALEEKEFALELPGDPRAYAALRDSTMIERLFEAAARHPGGWAARLMGRRPAKLILGAANAKPADRELLASLKRAFTDAGVPHFELTSRQYLSRSAPDHGDRMLVRRKMFGRYVYEPIATYSALLNKYNEIIDSTNVYVLPEHYGRAESVVSAIAK